MTRISNVKMTHAIKYLVFLCLSFLAGILKKKHDLEKSQSFEVFLKKFYELIPKIQLP